MHSYISHNRKAFTLMEIMCCLIIISIVSSITLPSINNFYSSDRCKSEAEKFVSSVRQAKYTAMQNATPCRIIFAAEDYKYKVQILDKVDNRLPVEQIQDDAKSNDSDHDYENGLYWASIADTEEIEIDPVVDVSLTELKKLTPTNETYPETKLYFMPDSHIYYWDSNTDKLTILNETRVAFRYGSAIIVVSMNAIGIISSEAFSSDKDDIETIQEDEIEW